MGRMLTVKRDLAQGHVEEVYSWAVINLFVSFTQLMGNKGRSFSGQARCYFYIYGKLWYSSK